MTSLFACLIQPFCYYLTNKQCCVKMSDHMSTNWLILFTVNWDTGKFMVRSSALHCGFSGYNVLHKIYCDLHNAYLHTTKPDKQCDSMLFTVQPLFLFLAFSQYFRVFSVYESVCECVRACLQDIDCESVCALSVRTAGL